MFVSEEILVPASYPVVRARLASLIHGNGLRRSSDAAYRSGVSTIVRVGPTPLLTRLVSVEFRDLVTHSESSLLTLRWETAGSAGGLFPVLDADITISPEGADHTRLRLDGSYRPPLGVLGASLDRAIMHRVATATIRSFVADVGGLLANPEQGHAPAAEDEAFSWLPHPEVT